MIADIVGFVHCEHIIRTERPAEEWERRGRFEERTCMKRAEALLRYTSWRGNSTLCVKSFTSLTPTGWTAWMDREGTGHVRCAEHPVKGYMTDTRSHVKS